jgi:SAM-dependent methyltransferase
MKILNVGCGSKTSSIQDVINIDWSMYLRMKRNRILRPFVPLFLQGERLDRFNFLPENILVHNLAKGIPFLSSTVDVVYHSHFLEHIDRGMARNFLLEVKRVLKPGGIHRIVVPDLEKACRAYIAHICICESDTDEARMHDIYVARLIEQSVRKEAYGTSQQNKIRRLIENVLLGDARRRGETHQWMYDKINISYLLRSLGFTGIKLQQYNTSLIPDWGKYNLDSDERGNEYKPDSLYIEANT